MGQVSIDMSGKVALVTGGAYGMGRASARRFAECGAAVVIADIAVERGNETVELIRAAGGEASFLETDVSEPQAVEALFAFVVETYGGLDYAHNNAGIIGPQFRTPDYPLGLWNKTLATNLTGVFLCMQGEIPLMLARGGGAIVNVSSETTYKGNVETGIVEGARLVLTPEQIHAMETVQPIGRLSQPEEIAELVVWLCSDAAVTINATRIAADTGWHVS
jgi:NAD(P)-dependent dehydrogenase (short-subunit alcohol dehydrogenase family)